MNTRPLATGMTLLSGAGGSGRTSTALGLAARLAHAGHKTLFFDLCFGWGGLSIGGSNLLSYDKLLDTENSPALCHPTGYGFDLVTCLPTEALNPGDDDLAKISYLIHELGASYDFIILDPPSSANALSLLAAGLCEDVYLLIKSDASSVASSYCLLKALVKEGLTDRIKIAFGFVDSPEQAKSLKARFDLLTNQFVKQSFPYGGFVYRIDGKEGPALQFGGDIEEYLNIAKTIFLDDSRELQIGTGNRAGARQALVKVDDN